MHRPSSDVKILAGQLFDSYAGDVLQNRVITVSPDSGLIVDVAVFENTEQGLCDVGVNLNDESTIDLRKLTVLPGFVDAHVHCKYKCTLS